MRIVPIGLVILGCATPTASREPAVAFPAKSGSCSGKVHRLELAVGEQVAFETQCSPGWFDTSGVWRDGLRGWAEALERRGFEVPPNGMVLDTSAGEVFATCFRNRRSGYFGELFAAAPVKRGAPRKYYFRVQRYRDAPAQWTVDLRRPPGWTVSCAFADR